MTKFDVPRRLRWMINDAGLTTEEVADALNTYPCWVRSLLSGYPCPWPLAVSLARLFGGRPRQWMGDYKAWHKNRGGVGVAGGRCRSGKNRPTASTASGFSTTTAT